MADNSTNNIIIETEKVETFQPVNPEASSLSFGPDSVLASKSLDVVAPITTADGQAKQTPEQTLDGISSSQQASLDSPATDITGSMNSERESEEGAEDAIKPELAPQEIVADYDMLYNRFINSVAITNFDGSKIVDEHKELIRDFLTLHEARKLVIYVDETRTPSIQVSTALPSQVFAEMAYFIKESLQKNDVLTEYNFEHKVQYGKLTKNTMESLLRIMSHVYVPIFLGNKKWPDSVRKEFNNQLHKFMVILASKLQLTLTIKNRPF